MFKPENNNVKFIALMLAISSLVVAGGCNEQQSKTTQERVKTESRTQLSTSSQNVDKVAWDKNQKGNTVSIIVPKDYKKYNQLMTAYAQTGGSNPLESIEFTNKKVVVPSSEDLLHSVVNAVVKDAKVAHGGNVNYLKVKDRTVYILLDMDVDGWAGVSVEKARIHPLIEKSLLNLPSVDKVEFKRL